MTKNAQATTSQRTTQNQNEDFERMQQQLQKVQVHEQHTRQQQRQDTHATEQQEEATEQQKRQRRQYIRSRLDAMRWHELQEQQGWEDGNEVYEWWIKEAEAGKVTSRFKQQPQLMPQLQWLLERCKVELG